ncbi:MAG: HEPN domain-containing protein [Anaerolineales bacterium]|nr:HEPN domain-containing protein [Anaerolineales bacterium]
MNDINEIKSWIEHAEDDFSAARVLSKNKPPLLFSACFHAQQCAEKYMKALLIFKGKKFPMTHDLNVLDELTIEDAKQAIEIANKVPLFSRKFLTLK